MPSQEALVDALLTLVLSGAEVTEGAEERQAFLNAHRSDLDSGVVERLKAEADACERSDPRRALAIVRVATDVAAALDDDRCRAICLQTEANARRGLAEYERAVELYDQARELFLRAGQPAAAAQTRVGQIDALMYLGRYEEALRIAEEARTVCLAHGERLAVAKLDMNAANIYARLDRHDRALALFDQARQGFVALDEQLYVAMIDVNQANVLTNVDDFRGAERLYRQARPVFEAQELKAAVATVDHDLAFLRYAQGRYGDALRIFDRAHGVFAELQIDMEMAYIDFRKSDIYLELNLIEEAHALAEEAGRVFTALGMKHEAARALTNQAIAASQLGGMEQATDLLEGAQQAFAQEGNDVWVAMTHLHQAALRARAGQHAEALAAARRAARTFSRQGLRVKHGYALAVTADVYDAMGRHEDAARAYSAARSTVEGLDVPWLTYRCHHGLGRGQERRGNLEAAYEGFRRAVEDIERVRQAAGLEEHKTAFLSDKLGAYEDLVLLCLRMGGEEKTEEAWGYVERAKSRALVDLLAQGADIRTKRRDDAGEALVAQLQVLKEELNWFYNRMNRRELEQDRRDALLPHGLREPVPSPVEGAAARREEEITALLGQLKLRNEEYLSLRQVHAPLLSDIQRHLPDDTLLIEYYLARDRIVAFTLTWDGLGVHDGFCRPAQVWELLDQLTFQLNKFRYGRSYVHRHLAALRVSAEDCLAQLYRGLIEPLVAELADRQLIIVPHGALHYVPFHALHDGQGYLIESHQVSYAPSASVLKFCLEKDGSDAAGVLIMGLPDERIPHVLGEVEAVGSVFAEPLLFTGPAATVSRLQEHGPGCDVIHLATHAMFRQDNPLFSALKLADGWLIVHDIYNLDLGASLVTLSACETGVSRVAAGDELIGLVRGFLYAGTSSLVVSLWAVNDKSTAYLMRRFYRGLQAGQGNAAALREAQLETRERYDHPYYWAPFVLMGQCH